MRVAIRRIETEFTVACKIHTYVNTFNNAFMVLRKISPWPSRVLIFSIFFPQRNFSISWRNAWDTTNFPRTRQFYFEMKKTRKKKKKKEKRKSIEEPRFKNCAQSNLSLNDAGNIDYYICEFVKKQIAARGQFLVTIFLQFQSSAKGRTERDGSAVEIKWKEEREGDEQKGYSCAQFINNVYFLQFLLPSHIVLLSFPFPF